MAGLNFPENAKYFPIDNKKDNVASFELIPWILCQCKTSEEASRLLSRSNITSITFNERYPLTPLHWMIADNNQCFTIESTADGLHVYENPVGVLTNSPIFPFHLYSLTNQMNLTREMPTNRFSNKIDLQPYSLGMGAIGLPGDLSSVSRFIRAAFFKLNSVCSTDEPACVSQFFHILQSVQQVNGGCNTGNGFEKTIYSSCCNTASGIYYYTSYNNNQITAVNMFHEDLDVDKLYIFPFLKEQNIHYLN